MGLKLYNEPIDNSSKKWRDLPAGTIVKHDDGTLGIKLNDGGRIWLDSGLRSPDYMLYLSPFTVLPSGTIIEVT